MNREYRLVRIRQALVVRDTLETILEQLVDEGAAFREITAALGDLAGVKAHLERAARLTDPAAADPLVRRADELVDEPRRSIGS